MKQVNVVYPAHQGESSLHYDGPEGKVWLSSGTKPDMPNVHTSWYSSGDLPRQEDSILLQEPVVVHPFDYNIDFLAKFNKVFGCFEKVFENSIIKDKFITTNYGSTLCPENADALRSRWLPWEERIDGAVVISGGKSSEHQSSIYHLRLELADMFHNAGMPIAWYGGLPAGNTRPYFRGPIPDKIGEICKYRYHICTENTYDPVYSYNYLTEKLPHAMYGGSLGLYMGCYNVEQLVPASTFLDLRPFVTNRTVKKGELLQYLRGYTRERFIQYQEAAYQFMKQPDGLFHVTDMRRYYKLMLEVL